MTARKTATHFEDADGCRVIEFAIAEGECWTGESPRASTKCRTILACEDAMDWLAPGKSQCSECEIAFEVPGP